MLGKKIMETRISLGKILLPSNCSSSLTIFMPPNQPTKQPIKPQTGFHLHRGETQVTLHLWICSKFQQSYLTRAEERSVTLKGPRRMRYLFPLSVAIGETGDGCFNEQNIQGSDRFVFLKEK